MNRQYLFITLIALLSLGCTLTNRQGNVYFDENTVPPNGVKISTNFYCDQTEVGNIDWLEYMYWTSRVFGDNSEEYLATLPDSTVWIYQDTSLHGFTRFYLQSPAYRSYPVVGISKTQVECYSKWRADRVFEQLLIENKIIEANQKPTVENYFTIIKYQNGEIPLLKSTAKIKFYPHFRLATSNEWQNILQFSDSLDNYYDQKSRVYRKSLASKNRIICGFTPPKESYKWPSACYNCPAPTRGYFYLSSYSKMQTLWEIRGNVCEMLADTSLCGGGGWIHTKEDIMQSDTFHISGPNAYTGFRNVCEWRPIEELLIRND